MRYIGAVLRFCYPVRVIIRTDDEAGRLRNDVWMIEGGHEALIL